MAAIPNSGPVDPASPIVLARSLLSQAMGYPTSQCLDPDTKAPPVIPSPKSVHWADAHIDPKTKQRCPLVHHVLTDTDEEGPEDWRTRALTQQEIIGDIGATQAIQPALFELWKRQTELRRRRPSRIVRVSLEAVDQHIMELLRSVPDLCDFLISNWVLSALRETDPITRQPIVVESRFTPEVLAKISGRKRQLPPIVRDDIPDLPESWEEFDICPDYFTPAARPTGFKLTKKHLKIQWVDRDFLRFKIVSREPQ